jgi:hypothetical protein
MSGATDEAVGESVRRFTVDRREGDIVVVEAEDGRMFELPEWTLPPRVREGDVIRVRVGLGADGERRLTLAVDPEATRAARGAAEEILSRLRRRDPGGDIVL